MKRKSTATALLRKAPLPHFSFGRKLRPAPSFLLWLGGLMLLLTGFRPSSDPNGPAKENAQSVTVPFKGKSFLDLNSGAGRGEATHLGRFTAEGQDNYDNFPFITGSATLTAANGDQLYVTHSGMAQPVGDGVLRVDLTATITGGTGRFAGATGSYETVGFLNQNLGTASATFEGVISY